MPVDMANVQLADVWGIGLFSEQLTEEGLVVQSVSIAIDTNLNVAVVSSVGTASYSGLVFGDLFPLGNFGFVGINSLTSSVGDLAVQSEQGYHFSLPAGNFSIGAYTAAQPKFTDGDAINPVGPPSTAYAGLTPSAGNYKTVTSTNVKPLW